MIEQPGLNTNTPAEVKRYLFRAVQQLNAELQQLNDRITELEAKVTQSNSSENNDRR